MLGTKIVLGCHLLGLLWRIRANIFDNELDHSVILACFPVTQIESHRLAIPVLQQPYLEADLWERERSVVLIVSASITEEREHTVLKNRCNL